MKNVKACILPFMQHVLFFGTHPLLSLAEAKSVIGGEKPRIIGQEAAIFDRDSWDSVVLQNRLAGTVKLGDVLFSCPLSELTPETLVRQLLTVRRPSGKCVFAIQAFGGSPEARHILEKLAIPVKRAFQQEGFAVRWFRGEHGDVSPAAVAKLELTTDGFDISFLLEEKTVSVALTTQVQNADAWSLRDFGRPVRDARNGMLPPKLARLMVNLLGRDGLVLDPFCGGGTVLMEGLLLGHPVMGSDSDHGQIEGSRTNLRWLASQGLISGEERDAVRLTVSSAQKIGTHLSGVRVDGIVTEGFLGDPKSGKEAMPALQREKERVEMIWRESLRAWTTFVQPGTRIVCCWPVYASAHGVLAVDMRPELEELGYRVIDPLAGWKEKPATLVYAREDQHVRRTIVVLEKMA